MIVIKVILIIFAYLLVGIAVLEGLSWYDRQHYDNYTWIEDEFDQVTVVTFWPFVLIPIILAILYKGLVHFIKGIRIFFTTVVYLLAAMIDKGKKE